MLKQALAGALALAVTGAMAGQARAQQQPFASQEVALSPAEALRNAELLSAQLAAIPPQRPGVVDTYILSASLWGDPVFEREAKEAAAILGRHFDATERTILLSAGQGRGERTYPTAIPNNLQAALGKIGKVIDPNEDLVVVFLTSHGAPNGMVAMREQNRLESGIMPRQLRDLLAAAGIKRKVAIISACFSGNFILPMGDADTIVLTAAAADKTSFGCEPSRDWTYFGDALFNHALRGGAPLLPAYDDALKLIDTWENKLIDDWDRMSPGQRGKQPRPEHSNPLSHVGDSMGPLLDNAEGYGVAVGCAANLSFALDRARTGRALKGAADISAIQAAITRTSSRATDLGKPRGRSPNDVAKAIAADALNTSQTYQSQQDAVAARAAKCLAPTGP